MVDVRQGRTILAGPENALAHAERAAGVVDWDGERLFVEASRAEEVFVSGKRLEGRVELGPGDDVEVAGKHLVLGIAAPFFSPQRRSFTHAEFEERLAEELARAARAWRQTALAMVRTRHGEGARVLEAALAGLRAGDCVATFAPDEIELLLPDTSRERAAQVVTRTLGEAAVTGAVVGIAIAPEDADRPERFLRAARVALRLAAGGERPRTASAHVACDERTRAALEALKAALHVGSVLVLGEANTGRSTLARAALARLSPTPSVVRVPCARFDPAAALEVAAGATVLLEDVDHLQAELRDAVVHRFAAHRVVATSERPLDSRYGALGLWIGQGCTTVEVPPLRQRLDDVVPLAVSLGAAWHGREPRMSPAALARLRSYPWPGNVVELEVAMERAMLLAGDGEIQAEHLPGGESSRVFVDGRLREQVDAVERDAILRALAETNHNQTHAARKLGLSRRGLIYKMEKYGIKPPPVSARARRRDSKPAPKA